MGLYIFHKVGPFVRFAVAYSGGALYYIHIVIVFRSLMLSHKEAIAFFLKEVYPPIFPVEIQHIWLIGLIQEVYVCSLQQSRGKLVLYLGVVLILRAGTEGHRLILGIRPVVKEGIVHPAASVLGIGGDVEALLRP